MTVTPWNKDFVFNKFNTNSGNLLSVQFDLSGAVGGNYTFTNTTDQTVDTTLDATGKIWLSSSDFGTFLTVNPVYNHTFSVAPSPTMVFAGMTFTAPSMSGTVVGAVSPVASFVLSSPSDLALFSTTGGGTYTTHVDATGVYHITQGSVAALFTQGDLADVTVTYTYESAVPEPVSLALVAGGFGLMGVARRRGKKA